MLKLNHSDSRSFALEAFQAQNLPDLEQTILFYKTGYKIEVFDSEIETFVKELRDRYEASAGTPPSQPPPAGADLRGARLFISYADEDRAVAQGLCANLREVGLQPWMDKSGLEPGAIWDQTIREKLEESDYFLVLQSRALTRKSFSYVNKEINLALERQRFARKGFLYIIPLRIDDGPLIEELKDFQALSLQEEDAVKSLASTIRRDYQRRARQ